MSEEMSGGAVEMGGGADMDQGFDEGMDAQDQEPKEKAQPRKPAMPKMRKIKVNGAERTYDEDQVWRNVSKYEAADEILKEAKRKMAEAEAWEKRFEEDPDAALRERLGKKRGQLAQKWLEEEIEEEIKGPRDPRDLENEQLKARLKAFEDRDADTQKKADEKKKLDDKNARRNVIGTKIFEALKATKLSANPESAQAAMREMAVYMRAAREEGEDPTPEELAAHVEQTRMKEFHVLAQEFDGDQLLDFLGDEIAGKVGRALVQRLRKSREMPVQSYRNEQASQPKPRQQKFIDPIDERLSWRSSRN